MEDNRKSPGSQSSPVRTPIKTKISLISFGYLKLSAGSRFSVGSQELRATAMNLLAKIAQA